MVAHGAILGHHDRNYGARCERIYNWCGVTLGYHTVSINVSSQRSGFETESPESSLYAANREMKGVIEELEWNSRYYGMVVS